MAQVVGLVKLGIAWQDVRFDELHQIKTCSILQHDDKDRKKLPNIKEKRGFFTFFACKGCLTVDSKVNIYLVTR